MMQFRHISLFGVISAALLVTACGSNANPEAINDPILINTGDIVTIDYILTWSDDNVFATTLSGIAITALGTKSLERGISDVVIAGDDHVLWGSALIGHRVGDELRVTIDPQTSGNERDYDEHKVQYVNTNALGVNTTPTLYDVYDIGGQRAWVTAISGSGTDEILTFDLNARETWDSYTYELTILDVVHP